MATNFCFTLPLINEGDLHKYSKVKVSCDFSEVLEPDAEGVEMPLALACPMFMLFKDKVRLGGRLRTFTSPDDTVAPELVRWLWRQCQSIEECEQQLVGRSQRYMFNLVGEVVSCFKKPFFSISMETYNILTHADFNMDDSPEPDPVNCLEEYNKVLFGFFSELYNDDNYSKRNILRFIMLHVTKMFTKYCHNRFDHYGFPDNQLFILKCLYAEPRHIKERIEYITNSKLGRSLFSRSYDWLDNIACEGGEIDDEDMGMIEMSEVEMSKFCMMNALVVGSQRLWWYGQSWDRIEVKYEDVCPGACQPKPVKRQRFCS